MSEQTNPDPMIQQSDVPPDQPPIETPDDHVDVAAILPHKGFIEINGIPCNVRRLKTREFLSLINVMTTGLGGALADVDLDLSDPESVARDMSALMLLAVPRAADEFTVFLRQIVEPKDDNRRGEVGRYLSDNPDIEVMLEVFELVATQEKDDLRVLAGKAQSMWKRVAPLYQRKTA